jgi:hypothetical protein
MICSRVNKHCIRAEVTLDVSVLYGRDFVNTYFKQQESLKDAPDYR